MKKRLAHLALFVAALILLAELRDPDAFTPTASAETPATTQAAADRKVHPPPKPGEVLVMTIKELGNFEYGGGNNFKIPDDVRALSGSTVRLNGFMIPLDESDHVTHFALVPSLFSCCYGQPPAIQHVVLVDCPANKPTDYIGDEITVEGALTVSETKEDGCVTSLFQMKAASVAPKK